MSSWKSQDLLLLVRLWLKSCFLKNIGELGLVDSGISLASEEPEAGVGRSCPLVPMCLWSDGVLPAHQACSMPF